MSDNRFSAPVGTDYLILSCKHYFRLLLISLMRAAFYCRSRPSVKRYNALLIQVFLALIICVVSVNLIGSEAVNISIDELKAALEQDDIEIIENLLDRFKPADNAERSAYHYYRAKTAMSKDEISTNFQMAVRSYPQSLYAQKSLLELSQIAILEREYRTAKEYLLRVNPDIITRELLLASVYLHLRLFPKAIASAGSFINNSDDQKMTERAYIYIVEAQIRSGEYQRAMNTLAEMREENNVQYMAALATFKEGYCLEMMDNIAAAAARYQSVLTHYPYTEQSYQAEKRLFELTVADRIDTSELTTPLPGYIPTDREREQVQEKKEYYFAQVNAFSVRDNAVDHSRHLDSSGFNNIVIPRVVEGREFYAVAVGPFATRAEVDRARTRLKEELNLESFIIRHKQ